MSVEVGGKTSCDERGVLIELPPTAHHEKVARLRRAVGPQDVGRLVARQARRAGAQRPPGGARARALWGDSVEVGGRRRSSRGGARPALGRCVGGRLGSPWIPRRSRSRTRRGGRSGQRQPRRRCRRGRRGRGHALSGGRIARQPVDLFRAEYAAERQLRGSQTVWTIVRASPTWKPG